MLSHLRFHRKGTSNPSSPLPDAQLPFSSHNNSDSFKTLESASPGDGSPASTVPSAAPQLPPIARVSSTDPDIFYERKHDLESSRREIPPHQAQRQSYHGDSGFIGGVALRNYRRDVELQQQSTSRTEVGDRASIGPADDFAWRKRPNHLDASTDVPRSNQPRSAATFSTPTDLHSVNNTSNLGRRPAGARLIQDVPMAASSAAGAASIEPQKGKKSLPFLKNPMSTLLMRRKYNQSVPDIHPLQSTQREEPVYDPRIRGTRVHDFSAPRQRKDVYGVKNQSTQSASDVHLGTNKNMYRSTSSVSGEGSAPQSVGTASRSQSSSNANTVSRDASYRKKIPTAGLRVVTESTAIGTLPTETYTQPTSPPPTASKPTEVIDQRDPSSKSSSSGPTTRSRNVSLSDVPVSALPRHMKSTSSRFSFDMVGAANQEKLLEERHRQKELERKTTDDEGIGDARYDDFDEDAFDYDAMMDDDGLEERIPGVNADYDDEEFLEEALDPYALDAEFDPDNDQENFAGFAFQRSDPASALPSPGGAAMMNTSGDGDDIGSGFKIPTGSIPAPGPGPSGSSQLHAATVHEVANNQASVLDIQGTELGQTDQSLPKRVDDLYFDDGMVGFENEFEEDLAASFDENDPPFDESIFDNNDTDQFGRPVPGAFQQAQSMLRAAQHGGPKRESDVASGLSAQSAMSPSTAHTSLSVPGRREEEPAKRDRKEVEPGSGPDELPQISEQSNSSMNSVAAYQAALAAAAHRAAATGKFQRSSSPPAVSYPNEDDSVSERAPNDMHVDYDDVDDSFDIDDDAIIAEANASALANDSDGWYGQEFGFYSAPPGSHSASHGSSSGNLRDYEYANGGFFGPGGMGGLDRSTSGRMISREPNLTPITERSEYSNRNSLMSLGYPPLNTTIPVVQSPGLAQLVMMADYDDDQMTLSSLLRLRSKAWGGSQASVGSSREGSPRSDRGELPSSSWPSNSLAAGQHAKYGHARNPSAFSAMSNDSDAASASGSPTMTMANLSLNVCQNPPIPEENVDQVIPGNRSSLSSEPLEPLTLNRESHMTCDLNEPSLSEISRKSSNEASHRADGYVLASGSRPLAKGHRHKGSAGSVSYVKEEDRGETRWVLERRRTAESGQVEVLEREVIESSMI